MGQINPRGLPSNLHWIEALTRVFRTVMSYPSKHALLPKLRNGGMSFAKRLERRILRAQCPPVLSKVGLHLANRLFNLRIPSNLRLWTLTVSPALNTRVRHQRQARSLLHTALLEVTVIWVLLLAVVAPERVPPLGVIIIPPLVLTELLASTES